MTKKSCCCVNLPPPGITFNTFCCNPLFFTDFITLFGDSMSEHAEVSPEDWIALKQVRPKRTTPGIPRFQDSPNGCQCCCAGCDTQPFTEDTNLNVNTNFYELKEKEKRKNLSYSIFNKQFYGSRSNGYTNNGNTKPNLKKIKHIEFPPNSPLSDPLLISSPKKLKSYKPEVYIPGKKSTEEEYINFLRDPDLKNFNTKGTNFSEQLGSCCNRYVQCCNSTTEQCDFLNEVCNKSCCKADIYRSKIEGAEPFYLAYKYSGCNFIWYPREYTFDKDPYVSQCIGYKTFFGPTQLGSTSNVQRSGVVSCDAISIRRWFAGSAYNNHPDICKNISGSGPSYPLIQPWLPCDCAPHPHIHGGMRDSLLNIPNVRVTPGQLGYVSNIYPLAIPMTADEADCCWCASSADANQNWVSFISGRKGRYRKTYPFFNGKGRTVSQIESTMPGISCHYRPGTNPDWVAGNPNYTSKCYVWGISPYLLRRAETEFKTGYEIWRHGISAPASHDFGPTYVCINIEPLTALRDYKIKFKKYSGRKTTLRDQYIGFVQLEHHFECCAFRSSQGIASIKIQPIGNSCNLLIAPFERGYGGIYRRYTSIGADCPQDIFRAEWIPWHYDNNLYQIKRSIPRRVMYQGSGIPLFHFDLVAMEEISIKKNITYNNLIFSGTDFLEHYYRYFFAMISFNGRGCTSVNGVIEPIEWNYGHLIESFNYVKFWLEQMVIEGILRIKDHSIDIAKDINNITASGIVEQDSNGNEIIVLPPETSEQCGGLAEYQKLLDLFEVSAGSSDVTPKMVKDKLLNPAGLVNYSGPGQGSATSSMRAFLPRRARLPLGPSEQLVLAWGCTGPVEGTVDWPTAGLSDANGISCTSYSTQAITVPPPINNNDPDNFFAVLSPEKVICGLAGTFIIDKTGKLIPFGGVVQGSSPECTEITITIDVDGDGDADTVTLPSSYFAYPEGIACIPWYFDASFLIDYTSGQAASSEFIPDAKVLDIAFCNPNFAVAIMDADRRALGVLCKEGFSFPDDPENTDSNMTYEVGEFTEDYIKNNCNGTNVGYTKEFAGGEWLLGCMSEEPWQAVSVLYENPDTENTDFTANLGIRQYYHRLNQETNTPEYGALQSAFRLKSWGTEARFLGTFSLSFRDAQIYNFGKPTGFDGDRIRGYDIFINPNNLRYPGTNTWHIWTKIGAGMEHFVALDDYGGVFATPHSNNADGQCSKGIPLPWYDINVPESYPNKGFANDELVNLSDSYLDYNGFESRFNYYNHIPRPGFVKPEEWTQKFYNSVTSRNSKWLTCQCACLYAEEVDDDGDITVNDCHNFNLCNLSGGNDSDSSCLDPITGLSGSTPCHLFEPRVYDQTCVLMGSLCQRKPYIDPDEDIYQFIEQSWIPEINDTATFIPILQPPFNFSQPRYTDLHASYYNTILLTNENKVEIYGRYYQIDESGQKINEGVTCFIPDEVSALAGNWDVNYGCTVVCQGVTHSPILGATYSPPTFNEEIEFLKTSCDYSMCVTKGNVIHIWGDVSMVPTQYDPNTYYPGKTGYAKVVLPLTNNNAFIKVLNVALGVHALYINYEIKTPGTSIVTNKVYTHVRYQREDYGAQTPDYMQGKVIGDISAGYGFAVSIASGDAREPKTWNYSNFAPLHQPHQYKNFANLPVFLKRDAYFHAIPGGWDYSKWLFGGVCCFSLANQHPAQTQDFCSTLAYNIYKTVDNVGQPIPDDAPPADPRRFNPNLSRSGHPEHTWMRSDMRRLTEQATTTLRDLFTNNVPNSVGEINPLDCDEGVNGTSTSPGSVLDFGINMGFCMSTVGPCWGEQRPLAANQTLTVTKDPIEECIDPSPCDDVGNEDKFKFRGVCYEPDPPNPEEPQGPIFAYALNAATPQSYRSTKDVFAQATTTYTASIPLDGNLCMRHGGTRINYFKYSERNFFFGYNSEKDTWEIYRSPDIFRETVRNTAEVTNLYCSLLGNAHPLCQESQTTPSAGYTGATLANNNSNWGWGGGITAWVGAGVTAWSGLSAYASTGPNYGREDWVPYPMYLAQEKSLIYTIIMQFGENDETVCGNNVCSVGDIPPYFRMLRLGGPSMFAWKPNYGIRFGHDRSIFGFGHSSGLLYSTESPLTMLYGVENNIVPDENPETSANYTKVGFLKVLKDPQKTVINEPWKASPSTSMWIPLFWESYSEVDSSFCSTGAGLSFDNFCFSSRDDIGTCQDNQNNIIGIFCIDSEDGGFVPLGPPVTCAQQDCCDD
jgi:hypothetical protein